MIEPMRYQPNVSVVINTLNRGWIIARAIESLRYQDYPNFEVVVVNGPSTDNTQTILEGLATDIKIGTITEANISKSRNAGIAASAGEIILFLDDDAFAEPGWITNIVAAYQDPRVGGVGTRVWNHLGFEEQQNPRLVDENYNAIFETKLPGWAFQYANSRTIPHILGASCSFRRALLEKIGGFDEEIEYFLDESEVCRRIAELGYIIQFVETGASVHHKYAPGVVRDERRLLTHPYPVVKNKFYVCLSDAARSSRPLQVPLDICTGFAEDLLCGARENFASRAIGEKEFLRFSEDVKRAVVDGRALGFRAHRKSVDFQNPAPAFQAFPSLRPKRGPRTFCFICRHLSREAPAGISKFVYDLAKGFAGRGHDVTIITEATEQSEILYESGIWWRKLVNGRAIDNVSEMMINFESAAAKDNFLWSATAYAEIERMRKDRPVDLVVTPIWNTEGLHCVSDDTLRTVVTLQTTFKTYSDIEWKQLDAITSEELLVFERTLAERAIHVHAISNAIKQQVSDQYKPRNPEKWVVAHLGVDPVAPVRAPSSVSLTDSNIHPFRQRLTYVSRLEMRKGTDVFLVSAARLVTDIPDLYVDLIGKDVTKCVGGTGYEHLVDDLPSDVRSRIRFRGEISNSDLIEAYDEADVFCVPSRFESFGLIYLEAMRAGKPIVACNVGGVSEVVEHGITGLLVAPDNSNAVYDAVKQLLCNKELRRTMGDAGRKRYEQHFTSEKMVERCLSAYMAMIDND